MLVCDLVSYISLFRNTMGINCLKIKNGIIVVNCDVVQHVLALITSVIKYCTLKTPWGEMLVYKHQVENKMRFHSLQTTFKFKCQVSNTIHIVKWPKILQNILQKICPVLLPIKGILWNICKFYEIWSTIL